MLNRVEHEKCFITLGPDLPFILTELLIEKRSTCVDHIATKPHLPEDTSVMFPDVESGVFPILASDILSTEPVSSK